MINEAIERGYFEKMFPQMNMQRNADGTFWNEETERCFTFWLAGVKHNAENIAEYHFSRTYGWCLTGYDGSELVADLDSEEEVKEWAVSNGYRPVMAEDAY